MTKFQKQMLTIAAAGALTAVTALPAMAFENEFHGIFNFNGVFSNYNTGAFGNFSPATSDKVKMNNYMEQRTRLQYTAKASDDLKLVTHFEINNRWGRLSTGTGGVTASGTQAGGSYDFGGNDLDTDGLNIVTKWAYLDFNIGKSFNAKVGLLPYKDTIKGIFIDADIPAIATTTKLGAYTLGLGFSRFADSAGGTSTSRLGDLNKDLFFFDNTYALSKDTKVALSYYLFADYATNNNRALIHTLGLSGETQMGALNLSGFAAMQAGHNKTTLGATYHYHGWAANVAAKMKVGAGSARTGFLFVSGDNTDATDAHNKGWQTPGVQSYNESGLVILTRNTANSPTSTDQYIRRVITNQAVAYLGYDAKLTDKFNLDSTVGFAWVPSSYDAPYDLKSPAPAGRNGSDFMGTEISMTAGYQLYKNLKLMAQAGYMILGGYYKNTALKTNTVAPAGVTDPENPYTMRLQARYSF